MIRSTVIALLCFTTFCHCIHQQPYQQPYQQQLGPQKYEIEEDTSKQSAPQPYHRTILAPKQAYDQNQLNHYYHLNQLNQLNQLQQQNLPQPQTQQYLAALQQFYAASKQQPQNAFAAAQTQPQYAHTQPQYSQQPSAQANYPQPLGVLYSAASDVSQFQFSGNGVNYSF